MHRRTYLVSLTAFLAALLAAALIGQRVTFSASPRQDPPPTTPQHFTAIVGYGQDDWAANIYNPHKLNVYVGDSVTWVNHSKLEPHTITFGPLPLLQKLFKQTVLVTPQKTGPPQLSLNPMLGLATRRATYDGTGYANSGFLRQGQRWTITFTQPGTYRYYCLIHFPGMVGVVVVHPRPTTSQHYTVLTGYGSDTSGVDAFFPETLTIHAGSTVTWSGAIFHTITFAPAATIAQLRQQLIIPIPKQGGPPTLSLNPKIAFPVGGHVYTGIGLLSSGILQPPHNQFAVTFTKPGVYHYGCLVHPGMDGTIRVLP